MRSFGFFIFCLAITVTFAAGPGDRPRAQGTRAKKGKYIVDRFAALRATNPGLPLPLSGCRPWGNWAVANRYTPLLFDVLDIAWNDPNTKLVGRFSDSTSISYTRLEMFQNNLNQGLGNTVMKRIQMQEVDHPLTQQVNQEVEALLRSKTVAVHFGSRRSENHVIVYIALLNSKENFWRLWRPKKTAPQELEIFEILDKAWGNTVPVQAARLFEDSKAEVSISYASLPMFPESKKYTYNAVIKRIQIPENDSQQVDKEIQIVMDTNEADCFYHGKTDKIAYIALNRDERNLFTSQTKGSEMSAEALRNKALEEFKREYPKLDFQEGASHWVHFHNGAEYDAVYI